MKSMTDKKKIWCYLSIMFILGILYYIPRLCRIDFPYCYPEDAEFHLNRLLGLENIWTSPVNLNAGIHFGSLVNIFYPWLTMYPMWIVYKICGGLIVAFNIYTTLLTIITMYITFFCLKKMNFDDMVSFICSVVYTFSAYRFADVFRRASLGETISLAFLPIVALGVYNIFLKDYKKWGVLCIGMTLIAYTHLLSLLITSLFVGFTGIVLLTITNEKNKRIKVFVLATFYSVLLSVGVLIPLLYMNSQNSLNRPLSFAETMMSHADSVLVILLNSITNAPTAHGVGLLIVLTFVLNVILIIKDKDKKRKKVGIILNLTSALVVLATSSLLPWGFLSKLPIFGDIQFPWRLNAYATLFAVLALAVSLSSINSVKTKYIIAIVVCVLGLGLTYFSVARLNKDVNMYLTDDFIIDNQRGNFDYTPITFFYYCLNYGGDDIDDYIVKINDQYVYLDRRTSNSGTFLYFTLENVQEGDVVDVPVLWYTTSRAKINGSEVRTLMSDRGTISFKSNASGTIKVEIYNRYNVIVYMAWLFSFIAFIVFCVGIIKKNKKLKH